MRSMTSPITGVSIVYSTYSSTSLALVKEIQWWPVDSPHKRPVTRKMMTSYCAWRDLVRSRALRELDESDYNVFWRDRTLCDSCRGDHKNSSLSNCQNVQFWNFISIILVTLFYYMGVLWHEFSANWYNIIDDIGQTICIDASANTKVQKCKCKNVLCKARNRYLQLWQNQEPTLSASCSGVITSTIMFLLIVSQARNQL